MIRLALFAGLFMAATGFGQAASACSIAFKPEAERRADNANWLRSSPPVHTGSTCAFVNGGYGDTLSAGPAIPLEQERFYQVLGTENGVVTEVLLTDCARREVVRLEAGYIQNNNYVQDSCGGEYGDRFAIFQPAGPFTLNEGRSFDAFKRLVQRNRGIVIDEEIRSLVDDSMGQPLPRKDQVDFLCGCRVLFPGSAGAR